MDAALQERIHTCSELLQSLHQHLDRVSDAPSQSATQVDLRNLSETLMALHGVLAGADAVLTHEVKRWGL